MGAVGSQGATWDIKGSGLGAKDSSLSESIGSADDNRRSGSDSGRSRLSGRRAAPIGEDSVSGARGDLAASRGLGGFEGGSAASRGWHIVRIS